ncbi:hypothetical protein [Rhizobium sp. Root708]|uniref:hypothetical protein n=1 Tax=Rhizobium sp. Root708 TaxID=1736592 RepID=UPI000A48E3C8|nr:hypothetical protein [Rhizobium sp. Root708]
MSWLIGIILGLLLPWLIRRHALLHAFSFFGVGAGCTLWAIICIVTVPIMISGSKAAAVLTMVDIAFSLCGTPVGFEVLPPNRSTTEKI